MTKVAAICAGGTAVQARILHTNMGMTTAWGRGRRCHWLHSCNSDRHSSSTLPCRAEMALQHACVEAIAPHSI
jgi:hypothetical protein